MRATRLSAGVACLVSLQFVTVPTAPAQTPETRTLSGSSIAVWNIAGTMTVGRGSGSDVVVRVTRKGADAERMRIVTGEIGRRNTLRVVYDGDRISYRDARHRHRTSLHVSEDGTFYDGDDRRRGRKVMIESSGGGLDAHADVEIALPPGKRLEVYLAAGEASARNVEGELIFDVGAASVRTEGTKGRLYVDGASGEVVIRNAEGDVELDTGSGRVDLADIRGDDLLFDTGSGGITGSNLTARRMRFDTGSGGVRLSAVSAPSIELDTGSGAVELDLTSDVDDLLIDTGSGGVTLRVPESLGAEIHIDASSGGIDLGIPVELRRYSRSELTGRIGDGRGRITIDTGSGGVRIVRR